MEGMEPTTAGARDNPRNGLGLEFSMSPAQRQQLRRAMPESMSKGNSGLSSASTSGSPDHRRPFTLIHPHSHSSPMSPVPTQTQLSGNCSTHAHTQQQTPNVLPSFSLSRPTTTNASATFGRFNLDDLNLDGPYQDITLGMGNLTPPATPMMHAQQLKGLRRYSTLGAGGTLGPAMGMVGGGSTFNQGQGQHHGQGGGSGLGGRSVLVPPSEARNSMLMPVSMSLSEGNSERGREGVGIGGNGGRSSSSTDDIVIAAPRGVTVKRSLSSTVHHSHGPGHSHSISTLPPFPSHSEIWRAKTPTAGTSSNSSAKRPSTPSAGTNKGLTTESFQQCEPAC